MQYYCIEWRVVSGIAIVLSGSVATILSKYIAVIFNSNSNGENLFYGKMPISAVQSTVATHTHQVLIPDPIANSHVVM